LRYLNLSGTAITDDGLRHLKGLGVLEGLDLGFTNITDEGMHHVGELRGLKELRLNAKIGDSGIAKLTGLPKLELLCLVSTSVTDASEDSLAKLDYLFFLNLDSTALSPQCIQRLRNRLPSCRIHWTESKVPSPVTPTVGEAPESP
jgi:hypothetical protein